MSERSPSPAEIAAYARRWREFNRSRRERARPVVADVEQLLHGVAQLLADDFGARKVVLFGSYSRGTAIETSDVDLMVLGVPLSQVVTATRAATKFLGGRRADLVPAEFVSAEIRDQAEATGRVLFERAGADG